MVDFDLRPNQGYEIAPCSIRETRDLGNRPDRVERYSDPGERVWDRSSGTWMLVPRGTDVGPVARRVAAPVPMNDGSGVWWQVWDRRTGRLMWTIEAWDFAGALDEKRRLCAGCGGASGWAYLVPISE